MANQGLFRGLLLDPRASRVSGVSTQGRSDFEFEPSTWREEKRHPPRFRYLNHPPQPLYCFITHPSKENRLDHQEKPRKRHSRKTHHENTQNQQTQTNRQGTPANPRERKSSPPKKRRFSEEARGKKLASARGAELGLHGVREPQHQGGGVLQGLDAGQRPALVVQALRLRALQVLAEGARGDAAGGERKAGSLM